MVAGEREGRRVLIGDRGAGVGADADPGRPDPARAGSVTGSSPLPTGLPSMNNVSDAREIPFPSAARVRRWGANSKLRACRPAGTCAVEATWKRWSAT